MPFPYFEHISADLTGTWSSPRKRKAAQLADPPPAKRKTTSLPCPHSMTIVRSSRQVVADKKECSICLEAYFSTPTDREKITPVKLACSHIFCRECIETHLSSSATCPLPWCEAQSALQPEMCALCAAWQKEHAPKTSLVVTISTNDMYSSILSALDQLATDNAFYRIPKRAKILLMSHIRMTLRRYEWQFHSATDLAELLDPFLLAIDKNAARKHYGSKLSASAREPTPFPRREHDADDYPVGEEPWIAAFLRSWAMEYVKEEGEVKDGWGVWSKKKARDEADWEWPYKRILTHKKREGEEVQYLVKWVGERYFPSWVEADQLDEVGRSVYNKAHGLVHES